MDGPQDQLTDVFSRFPDLYVELKALAHAHLAKERAGHTLNTTALANEAFIRLADQEKLNALDRRQFSIAASAAIRRVLVDYARKRNAQKRLSGAGNQVLLTDLPDSASETSLDLLDLNEAMDQLGQESERAALLVELRFFGGLTIAEAADALSISRRTAVNEWIMARGWLRRKLQRGDGASE